MSKVAKVEDSRIMEANICDLMGHYIHGRYDNTFLNDPDKFGYNVSVEYDLVKMCYRIDIRSYTGLLMSALIDEDIVAQYATKDWVNHQLLGLEPLMDTMLFVEWFRVQLVDEKERKYFRDELAREIKQVSYLPPKVHMGPMYRSRYGDEQDSVAPDWLAVVKFRNGGERREVLRTISRDASTWFSMLLMTHDTREKKYG